METENRYPTLADKKAFSQNIYMISSEDLGKLVQILDSRCESSIKKVCLLRIVEVLLFCRFSSFLAPLQIDPDDIEIDIDSIDNKTFWVVDQFVRDCLGANKKGKKNKKSRTS
jgi:hypothetical protein